MQKKPPYREPEKSLGCNPSVKERVLPTASLQCFTADAQALAMWKRAKTITNPKTGGFSHKCWIWENHSSIPEVPNDEHQPDGLWWRSGLLLIRGTWSPQERLLPINIWDWQRFALHWSIQLKGLPLRSSWTNTMGGGVRNSSRRHQEFSSSGGSGSHSVFPSLLKAWTSSRKPYHRTWKSYFAWCEGQGFYLASM